MEQEHQEVNELWTRLETEADLVARQELLDRLTTVLREDVRDEKDVLLPRLSRSGWTYVGSAAPASRGRRSVARRAHPPAPARVAPPARQRPDRLPLTMLDRSRDLLDHTARRSSGPRWDKLSSASGGLAQVAGRVEHWGMLRRGERTETHRP